MPDEQPPNTIVPSGPSTPPAVKQKSEPVVLSKFTQALIEAVRSAKPRKKPDDLTKLTVSQTVSFIAIAYEKVRNAVEYREDNLIRRAATERIVKRRLAMNHDAKGEGENILRELMWARYFPSGSMGEEDIAIIQRILDIYITLKKHLLTGRDRQTQTYLFQFLIDLLTCEIEETLSPDTAAKSASYNYFLYQTMRKKVEIQGIDESLKDAYFLDALEKSFRKSDQSYLRYHIFVTFYKPLSHYSHEHLGAMISKLPSIFRRIDDISKNEYSEKLVRFIRKQLPPFLILFELLEKKNNESPHILTDRNKLWHAVEQTCREKYQQGGSRLQILAVKSLIYIFVTKMLLAIILEYPVSLFLYREVNLVSIGINSLFPPALMLIIVLFFRLPGEENTVRIYHRLIDIIDADKTYETSKAFILNKKTKTKRPILVFGFTIFYSLTFIITLLLINVLLDMFQFNLISKAIFIFFVSVITFFSYRIKQVVREYRLAERDGVMTPVFDFFVMPIVSIGKFFSTHLGKLNFFIVFLDFIIEAPFKLMIEVVEEWISFTRAKKEEIV